MNFSSVNKTNLPVPRAQSQFQPQAHRVIQKEKKKHRLLLLTLFLAPQWTDDSHVAALTNTLAALTLAGVLVSETSFNEVLELKEGCHCHCSSW